ncbi:MAG: glycosyltransferase [Candidatus Woesearchaeota archaeon]
MAETIIDILKKHNNDYSHLEPFSNPDPIPSSIIIPIYNKADLFIKTLENLSTHPEIKENSSNFEIILVDDNSKDDIKSIVSGFEFSCNHIYSRNQENKGPSYTRNIGIHQSHNELIFFFDSDIILPKNYFTESWKVHNSSKNICLVGLAEEISENNPKYRSITSENTPDIKKDFRFYKNTSKYTDSEIDRKEYNIITETDWFKQFGFQRKIGFWTLPYMVVSHNISVNRKNVESTGGFDERFIGWGAEDIMLGAKLIAKGCYVIPLKTTGAFVISHSPRLGSLEDKKSQMLANKASYELFIHEKL